MNDLAIGNAKSGSTHDMIGNNNCRGINQVHETTTDMIDDTGEIQEGNHGEFTNVIHTRSTSASTAKGSHASDAVRNVT